MQKDLIHFLKKNQIPRILFHVCRIIFHAHLTMTNQTWLFFFDIGLDKKWGSFTMTNQGCFLFVWSISTVFLPLTTTNVYCISFTMTNEKLCRTYNFLLKGAYWISSNCDCSILDFSLLLPIKLSLLQLLRQQ